MIPVINIRSLRRFGRRESVRFPEVDETGQERLREAILSPTERANVVRRFLYFGKSVRQLAQYAHATEQAIQDVIRQDIYKIHPPTTPANAVRRAA